MVCPARAGLGHCVALCCKRPRQIEHTCRYSEHSPGYVQAPRFHDMQIHGVDMVVGLRAEGVSSSCLIQNLLHCVCVKHNALCKYA